MVFVSARKGKWGLFTPEKWSPIWHMSGGLFRALNKSIWATIKGLGLFI